MPVYAAGCKLYTLHLPGPLSLFTYCLQCHSERVKPHAFSPSQRMSESFEQANTALMHTQQEQQVFNIGNESDLKKVCFTYILGNLINHYKNLAS